MSHTLKELALHYVRMEFFRRSEFSMTLFGKIMNFRLFEGIFTEHKFTIIMAKLSVKTSENCKVHLETFQSATYILPSLQALDMSGRNIGAQIHALNLST